MEDAFENPWLGEINYDANTGPTVVCVTELIQKRAYEFFEARGREPGRDLEDWLRCRVRFHPNFRF
jgi:hypothetical protein